MNEKQVEETILAWYNRHKDDSNRWNRGAGIKIKYVIQSLGNWKNAQRGNPKKGYRGYLDSIKS